MIARAHPGRIDIHAVVEDLALESLLSIERAWTQAHPEGDPPSDPWGEGPSRVRLADLGLDARLRTHPLVGMCHRHGEFVLEWTGRIHEEPPDFVRCTATSDGQRCELDGPVVTGLSRKQVSK